MLMRKNDPIFKILNSSLVDLPTPSTISIWWNFGSLLGMILFMQIMTGLFLAMHYTGSVETAFETVSHITRDVNYGWLMRFMHTNGASMFFILLYLHIGRGLYFFLFMNSHTWMVGTTILFATMGAAFLGYVLPWGQMSFWGAMVITNLLSAIPIVGTDLASWLWGGFAVDNPTLTRFFALHFMIPFVILMLVAIHLLLLHQNGSNNPLGTYTNVDKLSFHPYFSIKDLVGVMMTLWSLTMLVLMEPFMLGDTENFLQANPLVTPTHIQPEWYFLFAYAILRSIPNKLGGVLALVASIAILFLMPMMNPKNIQGSQNFFLIKMTIWSIISTAILLTWIGARPVEAPYILMGQMITMTYFTLFLMYPMMSYTLHNK